MSNTLENSADKGKAGKGDKSSTGKSFLGKSSLGKSFLGNVLKKEIFKKTSAQPPSEVYIGDVSGDSINENSAAGVAERLKNKKESNGSVKVKRSNLDRRQRKRRGRIRRKHDRLAARSKALFIILVILSFIFGPGFFWSLKGEKVMNVMIINKTIPSPDYREHAGLMWVLNYQKIKSKQIEDLSALGKRASDTGAGSRAAKNPPREFLQERDFYGAKLRNYQGKTEVKATRIPVQKNSIDFMYLADTYGVYENDLSKDANLGKHSSMIEGGLSLKEVRGLETSLKENGTLVGEFNILGSPTKEDAKALLSNMLGIKKKGWVGRHFSDLSKTAALENKSDLPVWAPLAYEKEYQRPWEFQGSGWLLVNENGSEVVLEEKKDVKEKGLKLLFPKSTKERFPSLEEETSYDYWFELIEPQKGTNTLGNYSFDLLKSGKKKLDKKGIPTTFPAVTLKETKGGGKRYYFAGDWADQKINEKDTLQNYKLLGIPSWGRIFEKERRDSQNRFMWDVYEPIVSQITKEAYKKRLQ